MKKYLLTIIGCVIIIVSIVIFLRVADNTTPAAPCPDYAKYNYNNRTPVKQLQPTAFADSERRK